MLKINALQVRLQRSPNNSVKVDLFPMFYLSEKRDSFLTDNLRAALERNPNKAGSVMMS